MGDAASIAANISIFEYRQQKSSERGCYGLEKKGAADTCGILSNGAVFTSLYRPKKLFQEFHLPDMEMRECGNADEASSAELKD